MKRIIYTACSLFILAAFLISCSSAKGEAMNDEPTQALLKTATVETEESVSEENTKKTQDVVLEALPVPVSQVAWELYSNTYLNNDISQLNMQSIEGDGIFVKIKNNKTDDYSYYVWGCSDEDRTHDWQWELDLNNYTGEIPSNGSLVHYSGTFVQSELANDYYWLTNVFLNLKREFVLNSTYDYDCRTLSPTLAYYQLCHALGYISKTEGQTICLYGRVESLNMDGIHTSIQHPYINDLWNIQIDTQVNVPKVGSTIIVAGRISSDLMLHNCTVKPSTYQFNASQNEDKSMILDNTTIPLPPTPVFTEDNEATIITFDQPYESTIKFYNTDIPVTTPMNELQEKITEDWKNEDVEIEIDLYKNNLKYSNIVVRRKTDAYYEIKAYQDVGLDCYMCIEMTHTQTPYTFQEIYGSAELLVINRIAVMKTIGTMRN